MLQNNELAPIGLSTYSRPAHLKQTVEALQRNILASQSELYVFSDAPKAGDEEAVVKVRSFIKNIDGFKKTTIIERETNDRVFNNRDGIRLLLEKYEKLIFLEEDVVTAPGFLEFVNAGLNVYENRKDIFAICGYTPPVQLEKFYKKDVYLSLRFSAWGFGIWADRYNKICQEINYEEFLKNKILLKKTRKAGEDYLSLIKMAAFGEIDALDVKILYSMMLNNCCVVAPTYSLTNNIGLDGTGLHCGTTDRFNVNLSQRSNQLNLPVDIGENDRVIETIYAFSSTRKKRGIVKKAFHSTKQMLSNSLKDKYRNHWQSIDRKIIWLKTIIKILLKKIKAFLTPLKIPENANGKIYLHLGCGNINKENFINIDGSPYSHVHYVQSLDKLSNFDDDSVDLIYACHCLEHFRYSQTGSVLREWYRVLKNGGELRLSVPDFDKLVGIYKAHNNDPNVILPQLMGGQNNKYNYHLTSFNIVNLTRYLEDVGFSCIKEWLPGSEELTTFNDLSVYKKEIEGKLYEISLNIEAIK